MRKKRVWAVLGGIAAVALGVVAVAPQSGWIVRQQIVWAGAMLLPMRVVSVLAPGMADSEKARSAAAQRRPDDLGIQLAEAGANIDRLAILKTQFPNRPECDAAMLLALSIDRMKLDGRDADEAQLQWPNPSSSVNRPANAPSAVTLADWEQIALHGEETDPTNAFFPLMRAIGLFAAHRDDAACTAFERASTLPRYEDYGSETIRGQWRIMDATQGGKSGSVSRMVTRAVRLFPEYMLLRGSARLAIVHAIALEQSGNAEKGFAIRRAVARCGDRMRTDSPWFIGNMVGEAISAIARYRPGGAPAPVSVSRANRTAQAALVNRQYETYLRQIGHPEEIAWVTHEDAASAAIKAITSKGINSGPASLPSLLRVIVLWFAAAFLLTSALLVLLLGGVAALLSRTATVRATLPLKLPVTLGILSLAMAVFLYLADATFGIAGLSNGGLKPVEGNSPEAMLAHLLCAGFLCVLPLTMSLIFAVRSRRKKIPASAGITRGFVVNALPTATVLLLLFVGCVATLSVLEAQTLRALDAQTTHEGRTYAADQHITWPTFGPERKDQ